jgi:hypothetical protein
MTEVRNLTNLTRSSQTKHQITKPARFASTVPLLAIELKPTTALSVFASSRAGQHLPLVKSGG